VDFNEESNMALTYKLCTVVFSVLLSVQGCTFPTETSENYRRLSARTLDKVTVGMPKTEALKLLGNPWRVITYRGKPNETYLNWYWTDNINDAMIFAAIIDNDNNVIRTERWLDPYDPKNLSADTWP
jgi:outer membrane protein assembly factor BamE (lipoprotein component of BamABCDE complex)